MKKLSELGISPAPWVAAHSLMLLMSDDGCDPLEDLCHEDLQLMSAAPELYEALRELVVACGDVGYKDGGTAACYESERRLYDVIDFAKAALAKAAGRKQGAPMTAAYARALLAHRAKELHDAIIAHLPHVTDAIKAHKLAEICAECAWCEREYGEVEK